MNLLLLYGGRGLSTSCLKYTSEWTEEPHHDLGKEHSHSIEKQIKKPQCECKLSMIEESQRVHWDLSRENMSKSCGERDGEVARDPSIKSCTGHGKVFHFILNRWVTIECFSMRGTWFVSKNTYIFHFNIMAKKIQREIYPSITLFF